MSRTYFRATTNDRPIGVNTKDHVIRGVSVIKEGPALGHDMWIDGEFLNAVVDLGNKKDAVKSRFDHPNACSTSMGSYLGTLEKFYRDGDRVRADLHLSESAEISPLGNLRAYVEKFAEERPDQFGLSIVFSRDMAAEELFVAQNGGTKEFKSPDKRNAENFIHARVRTLYAGDVVDEPAANPDGLLSALGSQAEDASEFLDAFFGLSDKAETLSTSFGSRAIDFIEQWQAARGVKLMAVAGITSDQLEKLTTLDISAPGVPDVVEIQEENLSIKKELNIMDKVEEVKQEPQPVVEPKIDLAAELEKQATRLNALMAEAKALGVEIDVVDIVKRKLSDVEAISELKSRKIEKLEKAQPANVGPAVEPKPEPKVLSIDEQAEAAFKAGEFPNVAAAKAFLENEHKISITGTK